MNTSTKEFKKKFVQSLYKPYETEKVFVPPLLFRIMCLLFLRKPYAKLDMYYLAEQKFGYTGIRKWLVNRLINYDFTFPFPKRIYINYYYGGYTVNEFGEKVIKGKRLKSKYLIEFYETLKSLLNAGINESVLIDRLIDEPNIPIIMKKELKKVQILIETTSTPFYQALVNCGELFGKFESELINNMALSGKVDEAIDDIIQRLIDLEDYERALKSSMNILRVDVSMSFVVAYISMCVSVPELASLLDMRKVPNIIKVYVDYCKFMCTIEGIITHIAIILAFMIFYKYFSQSKAMCYVKLQLPILGGIFIHADAYKFMTMLTYHYKYLSSSETSKYYGSCNTVENEFIKLFFFDKIKDIEEKSRNIITFFERNNFFPSEVRYKMILGDEDCSVPSRLETIKSWYRKENKQYLDKLPVLVSDFSLYVTMGITLLSNAGMLYFEYYMMTTATY